MGDDQESPIPSPPLAKRFDANPILTPRDVVPSMAGLEVVSLLNPGAFRFKGNTWLLLRVAERPLQEDGWLSTPVLDPAAANGIRILKFSKDDPDLELGDPRGFRYRGETFLTTLSHLRLAWSDDGVHCPLNGPKPPSSRRETLQRVDCGGEEL